METTKQVAKYNRTKEQVSSNAFDPTKKNKRAQQYRGMQRKLNELEKALSRQKQYSDDYPSGNQLLQWSKNQGHPSLSKVASGINRNLPAYSMFGKLPKTQQEAEQYEEDLIYAFGKKMLEDKMAYFGGAEGWSKMPKQRQIMALQMFIGDDDDDKSPSFWSKLWTFVKDHVAPMVGGLIPMAAKALLNPTEGHLQTISVNSVPAINPQLITTQFPESEYNYNSVNKNYFLTTIDPSTYATRKPNMGVKTSLIIGEQVVNISTNAAGNCGTYVFTKNLMNYMAGHWLTYNSQNSFFPANCFAFVNRMNDDSFTPATGTQGVNANIVLSNVSLATPPVNQFFINSFSVRFVPNVSIQNSQGQVQMVQWTQPPTQDFQDGAVINTLSNPTQPTPSGLPALPQPTLPLMPYYQISSLVGCNLRYLRVPEPEDATTQLYITSTVQNPLQNLVSVVDPLTRFQASASSSIGEGFYVLVSGAAPSTIVGQIVINYVVEGTPIPSLLPLCPLQYACPGYATIAAIKNCVLQFPQILQITGQELSALTSHVMASKISSHDQLMASIATFFNGRPTSSTTILVQHPENAIQNGAQPDEKFVLDGLSL